MGRKPQGADYKASLTTIVEAIISPGGYYNWTTISENGKPPEWQIRAPQINSENETWMKDEKVELIHICHPVEFYAAMEAKEKDQLALHSGYVKDGICTRCQKKAPESVVTKTDVQRKLYEISRATR